MNIPCPSWKALFPDATAYDVSREANYRHCPEMLKDTGPVEHMDRNRD